MLPETAPRSICVLDVETAPDPVAQNIARRNDAGRTAALHRLTAFSTLSAREQADGRWTDFALTNSSLADEFKLLMTLDSALLDAARADAAIVTYNGTTHDLPLIARRAARHWMFGLHGLGALRTLPHLDLFQRAVRRARGTWLSLRDLCAGYGIPTDHQLPHQDRPAMDVREIRAQVDVVATFLTLLYDLCTERRSDRTLVSGWSGLIEFIGREHRRALHLEQFTHSRALEARLADLKDK